MVLDEATSALDNKTEHDVMRRWIWWAAVAPWW